jgi:hypothetical protein
LLLLAATRARALNAEPPAEEEEVVTDDLDTVSIWEWSGDQYARAWHSGFLQDLPPDFWDDLAAAGEPEE